MWKNPGKKMMAHKKESREQASVSNKKDVKMANSTKWKSKI